MSYPGNIVIRVIRARNLPKKDSAGSIDPYFTFKVGKSTGKTSTKKNTQNPEYGENITLNYDPSFKTKIVLCELYDWDRFSANDLVGSAQIPFEEFQNRRQQRSFPINDKKFKAQGEIELEIIYEAAGAPQYAPPGQFGQPPPQGSYGYPPPQGYGYDPQQNYGSGPQQNYGYPPQQNYGPGPQQGYGYDPQQRQFQNPPPGRPMKLKLKQKAITVGADKFTVKDETGKGILFVKGDFFAIGKCLHITDTTGQEVAKIDEQNTSTRYDINVKQPSPYSFTVIEKKGSIDILGLNWRASGKGKEFHVVNEFNLEVMHVSKESLTIGDGYDLYVTNSADLIPCVCIGLVVDATFFD